MSHYPNRCSGSVCWTESPIHHTPPGIGSTIRLPPEAQRGRFRFTSRSVINSRLVNQGNCRRSVTGSHFRAEISTAVQPARKSCACTSIVKLEEQRSCFVAVRWAFAMINWNTCSHPRRHARTHHRFTDGEQNVWTTHKAHSAPG